MAEHTVDEQTRCCPYLSLKRKRGTRLEVPSRDHRCYSSGEPLDIPLSQEEYCLSSYHTHCPLYSGPPQVAPPATGMKKWFDRIPAGDRMTYIRIIIVIIVIVNIYIFAELVNAMRDTDATTAPSGVITATATLPALSPSLPTLNTTMGTTGPSPHTGGGADPNLSVVVTNTTPVSSVGSPSLFFPLINR